MSAKKPPYASPDAFIIIGWDTEDGDLHELYDERASWPVDPGLVSDILVNGVLQPVHVRASGGKMFVMDGRQRVKAAREAASRAAVEILVPYIVVDGADAIDAMGIMISLNEHRQEDDPLIRASKAARMKRFGATLDRIAIHFGVSKSAVKQWFKVLNGCNELHAMMREKRIGMAAAYEVAKYPREEQVAVLDGLWAAGNGIRISQAQAKAYRREDGASSGSAPGRGRATGAGANAPKGSKSKPRQSGMKRTWMRKALESKAGQKLREEHPDRWAVLNWFATGLSNKGDWFDDFMHDVEDELEPIPAASGPRVVRDTRAGPKPAEAK